MFVPQGVTILEDALKTAPDSPGVYSMFQGERVLYVGKAKHLCQRLRQYTLWRSLSLRMQRMLHQVTRITWTVTASEKDALILESTTIKEKQPPYNVLLKDGKGFYYILFQDPHFPWACLSRGAPGEKALYYLGPFLSYEAAQEGLHHIAKAFLIRTCPESVFKSRTRPCLQYHIKQCSAPCVQKVSQTDYLGQFQALKNFFQGKSRATLEAWQKAMEEASGRQDYERARAFRDRIQAINRLQSQQPQRSILGKGVDFVGAVQVDNQIACHVSSFRFGMHSGAYTRILDLPPDTPLGEAIQGFLMALYQAMDPPHKIVVSHPLQDHSALSWLTPKGGRKVAWRLPKNEEEKKWMDLALSNGKSALEKEISNQKKRTLFLEDLKKRLNLEKLERIEAYDNSHCFGDYGVGAMVHFGPEGFEKKNYRAFPLDFKSS